MDHSDLSACDLRDADLTGASLLETDFARADLGCADFTAAAMARRPPVQINARLGPDLTPLCARNSVQRRAGSQQYLVEYPGSRVYIVDGQILPNSPASCSDLRLELVQCGPARLSRSTSGEEADIRESLHKIGGVLEASPIGD